MQVETFYYWNILNFLIMPVLVLVSQLEVYYKLDRFLSVLTAQQIVTDARWDTNKTTLCCLAVFQTFC